MRMCSQVWVILFVFQSHFVRQSTPHPKDLKARHQKLIAKGKNIDGHVVTHVSGVLVAVLLFL